MRNMFFTMVMIVLTMLMTGLALAGTVTVSSDAGTTNVTTALTGYATTGAMMDGMKVQVFFIGSETAATWAATGTGTGAASGTGWSLAESGDTYRDPWTSTGNDGIWTLTNTSAPAIYRILIDAGLGNTVFDTTSPDDPAYGTPGSARGLTFNVVGANPYDIVATYRDEVALTGSAPVGDLYRYLDIVFTNTGGFGSGRSLGFIADTDNILFPGDFTPVPLPPSVLLLGSGLLGLVGWRRFRKS